MAVRTKAQIQRDIKAWLKARIRNVDTGSKTVLSSLVLEAIALVIAQANTDLKSAQTAQGLSSPSSVDQADLDDLAYNYNLTRKQSSRATGFVTFRRSSAPSNTIRVGNEDGSGGAIVGTGRNASGAFVAFQTTQTVFFTTSTTQNPSTGFYEVSAPIEAVTPGTSGNVDAGEIRTLQSPVTGVDSITNTTACTGGKDEESNADLAVRLIAKVLGLQPGIRDGMKSIALALSGVEDVEVIGPDDSEYQRSVIGGVDLALKGSSDTTTVDQVTFNDSTPITLANQPAVRISSVVGTVGLTQSSLVEGEQWSFSEDTTTENRRSKKANSHLSWLGTSLPNTGSEVFITYVYDKLVNTVQDTFDLEKNRYPSADVLVKRGTAVNIDITFTVTRDSTIDSTTLSNNISTALTNYIDGLGLGDSVTQSGIISQIKAVSGVSRVVTPLTKLAKRGESGVSDISLTKYEYPQLDATSLSITVNT